MLTRRRLLGSAALAGAATLVLPGTAGATRQDWTDWIAAHRGSVGAVLDDGAGGLLRHRPFAPHVLASAVKVVHLAAYATAVAEGRLDPDEQVRVGDWDAHHPYVGDGGAHARALDLLGIPHNPLGIADDPDRRVPLDTLVAAMIDVSDNAATDYLRVRLGDRALRAAARSGGWRRPDLRSLGGEVLLLVLPEYLPPGAPDVVRRAVGDRLAARFRTDPRFREHVLHRVPDMPKTPAGQWPWARGHGRGSAAELFGMHHALAAGRFRPAGAVPVARGHLERVLSGSVPPGALGIGFKGGSLPRVLTMGMSVRWRDGRTGAFALMLHDVGDEQAAHTAAFLELGVGVLTDPGQRERLARALRG